MCVSPLIYSIDFVSLYYVIGLQCFAVYIIITTYPSTKYATAAGLKPLLLSILSSAFILLGSSLIYRYPGLTNLDAVGTLISLSLYMRMGLYPICRIFNVTAILIACYLSCVILGTSILLLAEQLIQTPASIKAITTIKSCLNFILGCFCSSIYHLIELMLSSSHFNVFMKYSKTIVK